MHTAGTLLNPPTLRERLLLLGLVTGNLAAAAHLRVHRALAELLFPSAVRLGSTDRGELTRSR